MRARRFGLSTRGALKAFTKKPLQSEVRHDATFLCPRLFGCSRPEQGLASVELRAFCRLAVRTHTDALKLPPFRSGEHARVARVRLPCGGAHGAEPQHSISEAQFQRQCNYRLPWTDLAAGASKLAMSDAKSDNSAQTGHSTSAAIMVDVASANITSARCAKMSARCSDLDLQRSTTSKHLHSRATTAMRRSNCAC